MSIRTSAKKSQTMLSLIAAFQSAEEKDEMISDGNLSSSDCAEKEEDLSNSNSDEKGTPDDIEDVIQKANEKLLSLSETTDFTGILDGASNYTSEGDVCSR